MCMAVHGARVGGTHLPTGPGCCCNIATLTRVAPDTRSRTSTPGWSAAQPAAGVHFHRPTYCMAGSKAGMLTGMTTFDRGIAAATRRVPAITAHIPDCRIWCSLCFCVKYEYIYREGQPLRSQANPRNMPKDSSSVKYNGYSLCNTGHSY